MPGTSSLRPLVAGAPGHGEGHNSGMAVIIAAAQALKSIMEEHDLGGQLVILPGVAEELLGSKAFYVRDGLLKDVDVALFAHVSPTFNTAWGDLGSTGMVSVEYRFTGRRSEEHTSELQSLMRNSYAV